MLLLSEKLDACSFQVLSEIGAAASRHTTTAVNSNSSQKGGGGGSEGRAVASALLQGLGPDACVGALVCEIARTDTLATHARSHVNAHARACNYFASWIPSHPLMCTFTSLYSRPAQRRPALQHCKTEHKQLHGCMNQFMFGCFPNLARSRKGGAATAGDLCCGSNHLRGGGRSNRHFLRGRRHRHPAQRPPATAGLWRQR